MNSWLLFGLTVGKALVVVGFIDITLSFSKTFSVYGEYLFRASHPDKNSVEFLLQLRNVEILHICLEVFKIFCSIAFWIGVIFMCNRFVLKTWIFLTTATDFVLIGVLMHHLFVKDSNPSWEVMYSWSLRMLLRLWMVSVAYHFAQRDAFPEEDVGGRKEELLPIGEYLPNMWTFYVNRNTNNGPQLFLTVDLIWSCFQILENEMDQIIFGRSTVGLISLTSTPVMVEERFIRSARIIFDIVFLINVHRFSNKVTFDLIATKFTNIFTIDIKLVGLPPLGRLWIVPVSLSIIISLGIFILMTVFHESSSSVILGLFYFTFTSDIIFRFITFVICLKSYSSQLTTRNLQLQQQREP